jgi:hypothetical protein
MTRGHYFVDRVGHFVMEVHWKKFEGSFLKVLRRQRYSGNAFIFLVCVKNWKRRVGPEPEGQPLYQNKTQSPTVSFMYARIKPHLFT